MVNQTNHHQSKAVRFDREDQFGGAQALVGLSMAQELTNKQRQKEKLKRQYRLTVVATNHSGHVIWPKMSYNLEIDH